MKDLQLLLLILFFSLQLTAQQISLGQKIFDLQTEHTHGSTIVELPNGDLLAAWFQGHGERWADDVRIMGARLLKGQKKWTKAFVMADVPEFPDINPCLFLDPKENLWLVWYTVIANQWETSLVKYRISSDYQQQSNTAPTWHWQDVLYVKPGDSTERGIQADDKFVASVQTQLENIGQQLLKQNLTQKQLEEWIDFKRDILAKARGDNMIRPGRLKNKDGTVTSQKLGYPYFRRMGWQTKNKATFVGDRMLLPLYSDGLEMSLFAITDDYGKHWQFSAPIVGISNIQAAIAKKKDGTLVAYMRDNGPPPQRHPMSFSKDNGLSWSAVKDSELPNPGSGSDVVTLQNGHWLIAYNDTEDGRHSLAISCSTDEGKTWSKTRHIQFSPTKKQADSAAYPAIIQGKDKTIHVVFSYSSAKGGECIKYFSFKENWILDKEGF
ncbi:MAG TPA: neuraminidase (sialidase)-like protein [Saprospiraceae bacterium]|nr:neuraminidase (sialidase)-like protein [Saprospiraceae bacterium]